jgi:type I restriction enzyme R subunit
VASVAPRSNWHHADDDKGALNVVMTCSASDPLDWQPHIRNKPPREALANRFRDAKDPFTIVLARDMWLTGLDAPSLHMMYVAKPMRGHGPASDRLARAYTAPAAASLAHVPQCRPLPGC